MLELTVKFWETLISLTSAKIIIIHTNQQLPDLFTVVRDHQEDKRCELIITKTTYIQIFKECHKYFDKCKYFEKDPLELYIGTIGILLTTHENKTMFNIHQNLLLQFASQYNQDKFRKVMNNELKFIESLLTSNNPKLNKSSLLWLLYKKLFLLQIKRYPDMHIEYKSTIFDSAQQHFASYYCWNTLRWFYQVNKSDRIEIINQTLQFGIMHQSDISCWDSLSYFICSHNRYFNHCEYTLLHSQIGLKSSNEIINMDNSDIEDEIEKVINTIVTKITNLQICEWPPFKCLSDIMLERKYLFMNIQNLWAYEGHNNEPCSQHIFDRHGNITIPREYKNDLRQERKYIHYSLKQKCINETNKKIGKLCWGKK